MSLSGTLDSRRSLSTGLSRAVPWVAASVKRDALLAVLLFALGVSSRIPFRSEFLYHWDSVNFALAMERFDLSAGQPHPPGYLLYVALARLVNLMIANPPEALVLISVVSSGLSATALFWLGKALYGRTAGVVAALFLLTSPLFWFYGEVALPHTLDTFLVIFTVYLLYRVWSAEHAYLYPAVATLAAAGGFRPQTLAFLAPLAVLAATRIDWAARVKGGLLLAVLCAVWLVPLLWWAGGPARYRELTTSFSSTFRYFEATTLLLQGNAQGLLYSLDKLARYTAYAWGLAVLPVALYVWAAPGRVWAGLRSSKAAFVLTWIVPSLLFYVFVHMGQQGLVFVFFPALLLISAEATRRCRGLFGTSRSAIVAGLAAILAVNALTFVLAPQYLLSGNRLKVLSRNTINATDAYYAAVLDTLRDRFPPDDTVLVGANWRQIGYYLPEYRLIKLPLRSDFEPEDAGDALVEREIALGGIWPSHPRLQVVFFDRGLRQVVTSVGPARPVVLLTGDRIWHVTVAGLGRLRWRASTSASSDVP